MIRSVITAFIIALFAAGGAEARPRGIVAINTGSSFNGGAVQVNFNDTQVDFAWPFTNFVKNMATWSLVNNLGSPSPADIDLYGYPIPGTPTMASYGGVYNIVHMPAELYVVGNCIPAQASGYCLSMRVNGKGTVLNPGTIITGSAPAANITTGSTTVLGFAGVAQDFRAGMEVPITGASGVVQGANGPHPGSGLSADVFTVCTANLTTTQIQLCLNDQVTPLQSTGTASTAATVSYGRAAVGVATKGRFVTVVNGSPEQFSVGITATDATSPITYANDIDAGLVMVLQGSEETRYQSGCTDCIFGSQFLSRLKGSNVGILRALNSVGSSNATNFSREAVWADHKPVSYVNWASDYVTAQTAVNSGTKIFAGTTTSVGNDYSVTFGSGAPPDKTRLVVQWDAQAASTNNSGSGVAAQVTATSHGLSAGDPFNFFYTFTGATIPTFTSTFTGTVSGNTLTVSGSNAAIPFPGRAQFGFSAGVQAGTTTVSGACITSATITAQPSGTPNGDGNYTISGGAQTAGPCTMTATGAIPTSGQNQPVYFVSSVIDADHFTFSPASGGPTVATTNSGANLLVHKVVVNSSVTFAGGNTATINWANHGLNIGDWVGFYANSGGLPTVQATGAFILNNLLYCVVSTPTSGTITVASACGGTALTFSTTGGTIIASRAPTLNYNGTGAVPIMSALSQPIATGQASAPYARLFGKAQQFSVLVYDKLVNAWLKVGSDGSTGTSAYMTGGWPPEIFVRLCYVIGAQPWFVSPPYTLDGYTDPTTHVGGITDYMPSLMTYIRDNYQNTIAPWMVPYIEVHNELWNNPFPGTQVSYAHSGAYSESGRPVYAGWNPTGSSVNAYAGKVASVLGQAAQNVYGGTLGQKYHMILGFQTASMANTSGSASPNGPAANAERMTSSNYVGQTVAAQSGYALDPASKWVSDVAGTGYVNPGQYTTADETAEAATWAGGVVAGSITAGNPGTLNITTFRIGTVGVGTQISSAGVIPGTTIAACPGGNCSIAGAYTLDRAYTSPVGSNDFSTFASSPSGAQNIALQTYIDSMNYTAQFTGSVSGTTTLTVSSVTSGKIYPSTAGAGAVIRSNGFPDLLLWGAAAPSLVAIKQQLTGTPNGVGTYLLSSAVTASGTMYSTHQFGIMGLDQVYANISIYANTYTNRDSKHPGILQYEGSYTPDYAVQGVNGGRSQVDQFRWAGKNVASTPLMANGILGYIQLNNTTFKNRGGLYPSLFQFSGRNPTNNDWSALEDIYQQTQSPIWNGFNTWH
jgi:hypothetical protein